MGEVPLWALIHLEICNAALLVQEQEGNSLKRFRDFNLRMLVSW